MAEYPLPDIPHLRLRFTLEAERDTALPGYQGSLLRGAFGHALRRAVCAMGPDQPCETCSLRRACVHARLFEALGAAEPPGFLHGRPAAPRPYVFEPLDRRRRYDAGDALTFDLLLFGAAVELQAFAVLAVERMASRGLGARLAPFRLIRAAYADAEGAWQPGYEPDGRRWCDVDAVPVRRDPVDDHRVRLRFLTPTRLKEDGHLLDRVPFPTLAFRMLRRVLEVAHYHVPGAEIDWRTEPLIEKAGEVRVTGEELRWHDWRRYSHRQRSGMRLGGFVGEMTLEGDLRPFHALLRTAELVHVGKGATFGLGRLAIDAV